MIRRKVWHPLVPAIRGRLAALALASAAVLGPGVAHGQILNYATFVSGGSLSSVLGYNSTIGFAYAGNKFVGSVYFGSSNSQLYATDLDGTNVRKFGTPIPTASGEMYVSSSIGLGGFVPRNVFAGSEAAGNVYQVANDGSTVGLFASGLTGGVRSIAFDPYGLYGYDMIVATNAGRIYRVDMLGSATLLANVGADVEGLSFAPQTTGPMAKGTLVVASEGTGNLYTISPTGSFAAFASVPSAEMVSFVPLNLGQSGDPVEGFYAAAYPNNVVKVSYNQFLPYLGDIIVTGETTHQVTRVHWDGGSGTWVTSVFANAFPGQPEDGIFVTLDIITPPGTTVPEPETLALLAPGLLLAIGLARRRRSRTKS